MELTQLDKKFIDGYNFEQKAKWWCSFNKFKWPEDFPMSCPHNMDMEFDNHREITEEIWPIMEYLIESIGHEIVLMEWNREENPFKDILLKRIENEPE